MRRGAALKPGPAHAARVKLTFITGNAGKAEEAREALAPLGYEVEALNLKVTEPQADSLEEVAKAKVEAARARIDGPFFVDDAGLFVDALHGFPGVYSAYALKTLGTPGILRLLEGALTRRARFEAVVGFHHPATGPRFFKGVCEGRISETARSLGHGFGFDPIFMPEGHERTFAELPTAEKNRMSHRGRAMAAFAAWLATRPFP